MERKGETVNLMIAGNCNTVLRAIAYNPVAKLVA